MGRRRVTGPPEMAVPGHLEQAERVLGPAETARERRAAAESLVERGTARAPVPALQAGRAARGDRCHNRLGRNPLRLAEAKGRFPSSCQWHSATSSPPSPRRDPAAATVPSRTGCGRRLRRCRPGRRGPPTCRPRARRPILTPTEIRAAHGAVDSAASLSGGLNRSIPTLTRSGATGSLVGGTNGPKHIIRIRSNSRRFGLIGHHHNCKVFVGADIQKIST